MHVGSLLPTSQLSGERRGGDREQGVAHEQNPLTRQPDALQERDQI